MRAAKSKPGPPAAATTGKPAGPAGQDSGPAAAGDEPRRGWLIAAVAALALAAAAATFTEVFNYDIFWHLASGDWMLAHGRGRSPKASMAGSPSRVFTVALTRASICFLFAAQIADAR